MTFESIHLFPNGDIEQSEIPGYTAVTENGLLFPAQTRTEWFREAKKDKKKCVYHETEGAARAALIKEKSCSDSVETN